MPISPIIIPPSRTWLLQPLDAGAFSPFKHILTELYQGARACSEAGEVSLQDFITCIGGAILGALNNRNWGPEFDRCGFGQQQQLARPAAWRKFGIESCIIPTCPTSYEQLQLFVPWGCLNNLLNLCQLVQYSLPAESECVAAVSGPSGRGAPAPLRVENAIGRTRSQTRALMSYPRGQPLPGRRLMS